MAPKCSSFLVFAAFAASIAGCILEPRYDLRVVKLHKDVAQVLVFVPDRLGVETYRSIAERELKRLLDARDKTEVPLYEVRFEFLTPSSQMRDSEKVASLTWKLDASASGLSACSEEHSIVLY